MKSRGVILLGTLLLLGGCSAFSPTAALLQEAHEAVKRNLKDPNSAEFRDEAVYVFPDQGIVCNGEVNSRNSFGGFTGFQQYLYERKIGVALDEQAKSDADHELWLKLMDHCSRAIQDRTAKIMKAIPPQKPAQ